ncbi:hypothetical protein BSLG_008498 [Batrachochytrium salamandrivorans]|nr:hypothetical protein BSLG_008498 [Batrachochytrium salamandrivorans]
MPPKTGAMSLGTYPTGIASISTTPTSLSAAASGRSEFGATDSSPSSAPVAGALSGTLAGASLGTAAVPVSMASSDLGRSSSMYIHRRSVRAGSAGVGAATTTTTTNTTATVQSPAALPLVSGIPELSTVSHKNRRSISVPLNLHISETLSTLDDAAQQSQKNQHQSPSPRLHDQAMSTPAVSKHRRQESLDAHSQQKLPPLNRPPINVCGPFTAATCTTSHTPVEAASSSFLDTHDIDAASSYAPTGRVDTPVGGHASIMTDDSPSHSSKSAPHSSCSSSAINSTTTTKNAFDLSAFMLADIPPFGPERMPKLVMSESIRSPIFTPQTSAYMFPHLVDALVGSLPPDAWDWASVEVDLTARDDISGNDGSSAVEGARPVPTLESVLTKDKRGHVVLNLWETERSYTSQLGIIQRCYQQRLAKRNIISETANNLIFSGTGDLYILHQRFFERLCEVVNVDNWSTTESQIGALFLDMKDEFVRLYTRFIDNYAISQKSMKKEEKTNEEYQNFMKEATKLRETNRQALKDFLILPVQRTTRYHILLKDLCKSTPSDHPDRKDLEMAWEAMNNLAAMVNEKKRREEEATGLFDAFESTKHCPPQLISHKRRLIMRVEANERTTKRDVQLVLCSDSLMITVPARSGVLGFRSAQEHPYRFVRWHHILELDISDPSVDDAALISRDMIRISIDISKRPLDPDPQVVSTHPSEITPKELSISILTLMFTGPDAAKNQLSFRLAIHGEMKAFREAHTATGAQSFIAASSSNVASFAFSVPSVTESSPGAVSALNHASVTTPNLHRYPN